MTITLSIDPSTCKGDGLCAQVCPERIFVANAERQPPALQRIDLCVLCGQCLAVCPSHSITHSRLETAKLTRIEERLPVKPEAFEQLIGLRRSVRVYRPEPVPREVLERVARVAGFAPTAAHGGEGWVRRVTIVSGPDDMRRVREMTVEYLRLLVHLMDSPFIRFMSRFKAQIRGGLAMLPDMKMRLAEIGRGRDALTYEAPAAVFIHAPREQPEPHVDCDAALMQVMLAAQTHGLGTCWNGYLIKAGSGFKVRYPKLREFLGLPPHHDVFAAATIGYPGVKLHSVPQRETLVHWAG